MAAILMLVIVYVCTDTFTLNALLRRCLQSPDEGSSASSLQKGLGLVKSMMDRHPGLWPNEHTYRVRGWVMVVAVMMVMVVLVTVVVIVMVVAVVLPQ